MFLYSCFYGVSGSGRNQERVWYGCLGFLRSLLFQWRAWCEHIFFFLTQVKYLFNETLNEVYLDCDSTCLIKYYLCHLGLKLLIH